jgi:hypothetical protein
LWDKSNIHGNILLRADGRDTLLRLGKRTAASQENEMSQTPRPDDPSSSRPLLDEADIGSGEKPPSQKETEKIIREVPPAAPSKPHGRDDAKPKPAH